VIILLCGGEGVSNTFAETLFKGYSENDPPAHLFASCGKNVKMKEALDKEFSNGKPNLKVTALGWTNEEELGKLFALGALEKNKGLLISAKAGGGTVSEAIARGIPSLICESSKIPHERMNLDFMLKRNLARELRRERDIPRMVTDMLNHPPIPFQSPEMEDYSDFHSKEKSMRCIANLINECRAEPEFSRRKIAAFDRFPSAVNAASIQILSIAAIQPLQLIDESNP
jgi:UDP-N-acetylglucosamine:LPS N-acetylglucosamine transferase